ncbi:hypothetical protein, partial [Paenibacillus dendritiformis]|uniref:hypothetical protein n=1 Tax=Paenibacillus dendritiformis TaxID=130049 RepID=UPI000DB328F5
MLAFRAEIPVKTQQFPPHAQPHEAMTPPECDDAPEKDNASPITHQIATIPLGYDNASGCDDPSGCEDASECDIMSVWFVVLRFAAFPVFLRIYRKK